MCSPNMKGLGLQSYSCSSAGALTGERALLFGSRSHLPLHLRNTLYGKSVTTKEEDRPYPAGLWPHRTPLPGQGAAQGQTGPIPLGLSPTTGFPHASQPPP